MRIKSSEKEHEQNISYLEAVGTTCLIKSDNTLHTEFGGTELVSEVREELKRNREVFTFGLKGTIFGILSS